MTTNSVLANVWDERHSQNRQWGEQNHPWVPGFELEDGSFAHDGRLVAAYQAKADEFKRYNDSVVEQGGTPAWDTILGEEVNEALGETDPDKRRAELVQVAAVAVAMIESEDRRYGR